jgi:hypothetical protein
MFVVYVGYQGIALGHCQSRQISVLGTCLPGSHPRWMSEVRPIPDISSDVRAHPSRARYGPYRGKLGETFRAEKFILVI